jgi:hypothetical protein
MTLIGFDFSINKPAACVYSNKIYHFISWPYGIPEKYTKIYRDAGVNVVSRTDNKEKGDNISEKMRYEVENSRYIAKLITESLQPYIHSYDITYIAFEGLSYASMGAHVLQLSGYKYVLMDELNKIAALDNMYTYTPITIKSVAQASKKGMGKADMINSFIKNGPNCKFRLTLSQHPELFQSPKAKNWIIHLDDLTDSYWVLETLRKKENL